MKRIGFLMAMLFVGSSFFAALASASMERKVEKNVKPGVVKAWRLGNTNYCHLKFPFIKKATLPTDNPKLMDPEFSRLIDYYGPCNHDPLGEVEVERQRDMLDQEFRQD